MDSPIHIKLLVYIFVGALYWSVFSPFFNWPWEDGYEERAEASDRFFRKLFGLGDKNKRRRR